MCNEESFGKHEDFPNVALSYEVCRKRSEDHNSPWKLFFSWNNENILHFGTQGLVLHRNNWPEYLPINHASPHNQPPPSLFPCIMTVSTVSTGPDVPRVNSIEHFRCLAYWSLWKSYLQTWWQYLLGREIFEMYIQSYLPFIILHCTEIQVHTNSINSFDWIFLHARILF